MRKNLRFHTLFGMAPTMTSRALAICVIVCSASPALAQSQMIKDVNSRVNPYVQEYSHVTSDGNGNVYFISQGKELWKTNTNVTPPSTVRVKVLESISNITVSGNNVFFVGEDGAGKELWKTGGTTTTTRKVKEIRSGSQGSDPSGLTNINGVLYFAANNGVNGNELWKSNGTETGTVMVKDINTGSGSSDPAWMTEMNRTIYFAAYTGARGKELWKTNGTASGTSLVKDIKAGAGSSAPAHLANVNGILFFAAEDLMSGHELWTSNGTNAGTRFVRDINPGTGSSRINSITALGDQAFFSADDGTNGFELWKSNGTEAGTVRLTSHSNYECEVDENGEIIGECDETRLTQFEVIADALYYMVSNPGSASIYRVDGSDGGMRQIMDLGFFNEQLPSYTHMGESIYFFKYSWFDFKPSDPANDERLANQLYKMSLQGTEVELVRAFYHEVTWDGPVPMAEMVAVNNQLYFPGILKDGQGYRMLRSNGTFEGTYIVKDSYYATLSSNPRDMFTINGITIFTTGDNDLNNSVWRTDGTSAGTFELKEFQQLVEITASGNSVYVIGARTYGEHELWKTDGTVAGTILLKEFETSTFGYSYTQIHDVYGTPYFASDQGELWKSNGTPSGTIMLRDFSRINYLGKAGGRAIISATIAGRHELWRSNGTINSTAKLKTIHTNPRLVSPITERITANDIFYFVGETTTHGHEVWRTDGTTNGTYMLKDIRQNDLHDFEEYNFAAFRDSLYFTAETGGNQFALFKSDGTTAGTTKVADVPSTFKLVPADEYLSIFTNSVEGLDLWTSRGTSESTKFVKNLEPSHFYNPTWIVYDGITYVTSEMSAYIWRTDGTACGTFPLDTPEAPYPIALNGTDLIFGAYAPRFGREPHRLSLLDVPSSPCADETTIALFSNTAEARAIEYGPNPFNDKVTLQIKETGAERVSITVKSFSGEIVYRADDLLVDGAYSIGEQWPKGLYMVDVMINGRSESFRLVKK